MGGYGIRPYGTAGNEIVGAHSICARWQNAKKTLATCRIIEYNQ